MGGGAGNATQYLLQEYANMSDIEVHLVTSSVDANTHDKCIGGNVFVHSVPIGKNAENLHFQSQADLLVYAWRGYRRADELLLEGGYDAIHAFFTVPSGYMAMKLGKKHHIPYIVSLRGADVPGYSERFTGIYFLLTPLIRTIWSKASAVISNSLGLKELALQTNEKQEIGIIYNGVDVNDFSPGMSASPRDDRFVVTLGATRVTARKGIVYLLSAVKKLILKYPSILLEIMGDGNDRERLEGIVRESHLEGNVTFLGRIPREETVMYYRRANLFVLPSLNEGMSNAMLEALSVGLPIITTDTGGAKELVEDGVNGFIIGIKDVSALEERIQRFLADRELCKRMGEKSREKALQMSWGNVASQYRTIYESLKK